MNEDQSVKKTDELNTNSWNCMINDPKKGLSLSREAYNIANTIGYKKGMADSFLNEGWCCIYLADSQKALEVLNKGLIIYKNLSDNKGELKVLNALGVVSQTLNQYETALEYYSRCLELSKTTCDDERLVSALGNIGSLYQELGKYNEALDRFEQVQKLLEGTDWDEQKCNNLTDMGLCYRHLKDKETALSCFKQALVIARKIKDRISEAICLTSIGLVFQDFEELETAENYFRQGLDITRETGDRISEVEGLTNLGLLYYQQKILDKALDFHKQALLISQSIMSKRHEYKNYRAISNVYKELGQYSEALDNYEKFYQVESELLNEETEKKLKHISIQYEVEKNQKEAEIYRLRNVELKESYKNITVISQIGQKITTSLEMETILQTISENVRILMEADIFGIALYKRDNDEIDFKYYLEGSNRIPDVKSSLDSESSLAAWCIRNRKHILINNVEKDQEKYVSRRLFRIAKTTGIVPNSIIYLPLIIEDNIIGVITVQSYNQDAYTEQHMEILNALASYMAIALENSKIHEELNKLSKLVLEEKKELEEAYGQIAKLANHDILTGLPNRRLLNELLHKDISLAQRQSIRIAVLYIDLDNFKPVNDTLGHEAGDIVLKKVAGLFLGALRASDTVARIGGDEFVAILPGIHNIEDVNIVSRKLIAQFSRPIPVFDTECQIGISIGISIFPDDDITIDGLMKKADTAMYNVKENQKNAYQFYKDIPRNQKD